MSDSSNSAIGLARMYDVFGIQMRNIQAVLTAQQKLLTGLGMLTKQQAELMEAVLRRSFDNARATSSPLDMRGFIGSKIDELKQSVVDIQAAANLVSEIVMRSGGEAAGTLQARMMEALDELKTFAAEAIPEQLPAPTNMYRRALGNR